jgi:hypothetical protein
MSCELWKFSSAATASPLQPVKLSSILDRNHSAALVLAALLADAVRQLLFATVGAVGDAGGRQKVMATAFGGALFGVPALWIRHGKTSSKLASQLLGYAAEICDNSKLAGVQPQTATTSDLRRNCDSGQNG